MKYRNRYLVGEIVWSDGRPDPKLSTAMLLQELRTSVLTNFGDIGLGSVLQSMTLKYFNPVTCIFILRVGREETPTVWASATLITSVRGRTAMLRAVRTSGALRKAQRAVIEHDRRELRAIKARLGEEHAMVVQGSAVAEQVPHLQV